MFSNRKPQISVFGILKGGYKESVGIFVDYSDDGRRRIRIVWRRGLMKENSHGQYALPIILAVAGLTGNERHGEAGPNQAEVRRGLYATCT